MIRRTDGLTRAVDLAPLCFDKYRLRTVGVTLDYEPELMPVLGHICIRKEWLVYELIWRT